MRRRIVPGSASMLSAIQKGRKGLGGGGNVSALQAYEGLLLVIFKGMSMLL
jgi:hypothetical protein